MNSLVLKLALTPALIGIASLVGRRWGPAVSGWLVGLPFTSGPVVFFLALDHGLAFAAAAAAGTLAGTISQAAFCLAYAWAAFRFSWPLSIFLSGLGFAASTAVIRPLSLAPGLVFVSVVGALLLALYLMPGNPEDVASSVSSLPRWDIPARMVVATLFVLLLTGVAPALGPRLSGLLAPFPLYAGILTVFAHRLQGPAVACRVLQGLLLGLFAFASFFLVLAALLEPAGIALAFAAAIAVALAVQAMSLWMLRFRVT